MNKYDPVSAVHSTRDFRKNNIAAMYSKPTIQKANDHHELHNKITKANLIFALEGTLEKGEISDCIASGYGAGSEPITFVKSGKEIKEKIPTIKATLNVQITSVELQLNALKTQIGKEPTGNNTRRYDKITVYPRYDYSLCEPAYSNGQYAAKTDENDFCSKYNTLAYLWCELKDDYDALGVMENNLTDSKKYTLSVSQLIALNFK